MGLDISLQRTGVAVVTHNAEQGSLVKIGQLQCISGRPEGEPPGTKYKHMHAPKRPLAMANKIKKTVDAFRPDFVLIEGYAYSAAVRPYLPALAETSGIVKSRLVEADILMTIVSPSALKKFAAGKGNAKKEQVIDAANELLKPDIYITDDNRCDALWLAVFGIALFEGGQWTNTRGKRHVWTQTQVETIHKFEFPNYGTCDDPAQVESKVLAREGVAP
jgi:Holliday junction resolvasome RuvABC endonuclease subunit